MRIIYFYNKILQIPLFRINLFFPLSFKKIQLIFIILLFVIPWMILTFSSKFEQIWGTILHLFTTFIPSIKNIFLRIIATIRIPRSNKINKNKIINYVKVNCNKYLLRLRLRTT